MRTLTLKLFHNFGNKFVQVWCGMKLEQEDIMVVELWYKYTLESYFVEEICLRCDRFFRSFMKHLGVNISEVEVFKNHVCVRRFFLSNRCHTTCKRAYRGILWVHDIGYEILRIFSTFSYLPLYFDRRCFSDQYIDKNTISNSTSPTFQRSFSVAIVLCL